MAGFCEFAIGLRAPKLAAAGAKSPIVSGGYLKYSRFWETATGDRVRSALRGRAGKFAAGVSRYLCVKSGVSDDALRDGRGTDFSNRLTLDNRVPGSSPAEPPSHQWVRGFFRSHRADLVNSVGDVRFCAAPSSALMLRASASAAAIV
jgi:hypothetical protein